MVDESKTPVSPQLATDQRADKPDFLTQTRFDEFDLLSGLFKDYGRRFDDLVTLQQEIGLDRNSGHYDLLRKAAHELEAGLSELGNDRMLVQLLQLRRNEKDLMLRLDSQYAEAFELNLAGLQSQLASDL